MNKSKINLLTFFIFSVSLIVFVLFSTPTRHGDGHEYSLITQAFLNHQTPDVRENDVNDRINQLTTYKSIGYVPEIFEQIKQTIKNKQDSYHGIFRAENNLYYGYHFWLYPAYVACVEFVFNPMGANPLASFQIANAILFLFLCYVMLFHLKIEFSRSFSLAFALLFGGAIYYLKWTHPEFFIVTFIFLGYLGLFKNRIILSFVGFSIAAMQVITLWALFIIIPLWLYIFHKKNFYSNLVIFFKSKLKWILFFLPVASMVFYYYNFGKINLIGASYVDLRLISLSHLFSMYFDINQGMIVGAPWLIFVLLGFAYKFNNISAECKKNFFLAIVGSILISTPLLMHTAINAGQSVFERYAMYSVTPILAWAGYYFLEIIKSNILKIFLLIFVLLYSSIFKFANAPEDYLNHKPWVKYLFKYQPSLYNPEPAVFYSRTRKESWHIDSLHAAVYVDDANIIKKILVPLNHYKESLAEICIGDLRYTHDKKLVGKGDIINSSYGWGYINGDILCDGINYYDSVNLKPQYEANISDGIDFKKNGFPNYVKLIKGLSGLEGFGRWSELDEVVFYLNKTNFPQSFFLNLTLGAFANNINTPVIVNINGINRKFIVTSNDPKDYSLKFELPKQTDTLIIKILPYKPISPKSLHMSDDDRMLGLSFIKISFKEAPHE